MITAAPAVPVFSKDPIFHISQKLSPQDKFMPPRGCDSKPPQTERGTITVPEPVRLLCFRLLRAFACSFKIHRSCLRLTGADRQTSLRGMLEKISSTSASLFGVDDDTVLQYWPEKDGKKKFNCPFCFFLCRKLHQQHNYLSSHRLFEI